MGLKVAVIGLSPSSHDLAPWGDPSWQLWGLTWDTDRYRLHRTFEMHDLSILREAYSEQYLADLSDLAPYMQEQYAEVPGSRRYPFEEVAQTTGDYWCSSLAYALALAIHEQAEEIGLYGIDMKASEEYAYQRANMEYLIGLARGKGIKVHIPDSSPLCKFESNPKYDYAMRYGRLNGNH